MRHYNARDYRAFDRTKLLSIIKQQMDTWNKLDLEYTNLRDSNRAIKDNLASAERKLSETANSDKQKGWEIEALKREVADLKAQLERSHRALIAALVR